MLGFSNQSWLTRNTEVLTTSGWMNVKLVELGTKVYSKRGHLYIEDTIISIGRCKPRTKIRVYSTEEGIIRGKNLLFSQEPEHCYLEDYEGELYNFLTPSNQLIIRNFNEVEGLRTYNNDYHLIWTAK